MFCSSCGASNAPDAAFCAKCGKAFAEVNQLPSVSIGSSFPSGGSAQAPLRAGRLSSVVFVVAFGVSIAGGALLARTGHNRLFASWLFLCCGAGATYLFQIIRRSEAAQKPIRGKAISTVFIALLAIFALAGITNLFEKDEQANSGNTPPNAAASATKPLKLLSPAELETARKKADAESAKSEEARRIEYAKVFEEDLLRKGHSVDVVAYGPKHQSLKLRWALVSKAMAFQFSEERQELLQEMKRHGFKKFTITDGYDESWTWTL